MPLESAVYLRMLAKAMRPDSVPSREGVSSMFDRIAGRYDLLNHLLSFGQDRRWRHKLSAMLPDGLLEVLDVATGTADQLLAHAETGKLKSGVGVDPAQEMLLIGRNKIEARGLGRVLRLEEGSAEALAFADETFDAVTISFGIRNVSDVGTALGEMRRVLKPNGRLLILEFSLPRFRILRALYLLYFRHILPRLGGFISGDSYAYRYLNKTVETFPYGKSFCALLEKAGFREVDFIPLTFGVVSIYRGVR